MESRASCEQPLPHLSLLRRWHKAHGHEDGPVPLIENQLCCQPVDVVAGTDLCERCVRPRERRRRACEGHMPNDNAVPR